MGYSESSAAGSNYGTTLLTLNTAYNVIVRYGFVAGTVNDTAAIFVSAGVFNPVESLNTPYLTDVYNGATGEIGSFTGIAIRQGAATTAAGVVIDNLVVGNNFVDVIPEPSAALLGSLAGLSLLRRGR